MIRITGRRRLPGAPVGGDLALSRAGAIAVVVAEHPRPTPAPLWLRLLWLLTGSAAIASGVAVLLWTGLGPGPLDVFITAVVHRWGVPITFVVWGVAIVMAAAASALGHRPGPGTMLLPLLSGGLLQVAIDVLAHWDAPAGVTPFGVSAHVAGVALVGIGAGLVIVAGLGAGTGELLAGAAAGRVGRPEPVVRTGIELLWLAVGWALGGTVGVGTVIVAALVGPAVRIGHQAVRRTVERRPPVAVATTQPASL